MKLRLVTSIAASIFLVSLAACGGGDDGDDAPPVDAPPNVPAMITITGTAQTIGVGGANPEPGVAIGAFSNANESTAVATATTDANGNYTLTITTNGQVLDGYVKATKAGLLDTYLYATAPLSADFSGASINMVSPNTFNALTNLCGETGVASMGSIAVQVGDGAGTTVMGAAVSSTPAAAKFCYNGANGLPSSGATSTATDGIGYMINVTGEVTVSATKTGTTFKSHKVTARAGALTTTLIEP